MNRNLLSALTVMGLAVAANSTQATVIVLVNNGGFEVGSSLSGWNPVGVSQSSEEYTGDRSARFDDDNNPNTISQSITTSVGATYSLGYYLKLEGGRSRNNSFYFDFGSATNQTRLTNSADFGWTAFAFDYVANSASTLLKFYGYSSDGKYYLDDVSVVLKTAAPTPTSTPTPEPDPGPSLFNPFSLPDPVDVPVAPTTWLLVLSALVWQAARRPATRSA